MVKTWIADVSPLYEENCYKEYYKGLPSFRREKADALKYLEKKAQSVGAWNLLERMRRYYGLGEENIFNLSHTDRWVMCSVQTEGRCAQLGCDMEKIARFPMRMAEKKFCREEYEKILEADTQEKQKEYFSRFWVLKESFMKATRKGLALPMDSFCIQLGDPSRLIRQPEDFPETYYYREYTAENIPCAMAVCSTDEEIDGTLVICPM